MRKSLSLLTILFFVLFFSCSEKPTKNIEVVDFDGFYSKIDLSSDYTYVINFWATWCSPCVKELPYFESVNKEYSDKNVKVILVSLDFPSQIESKLKPYIKKNKIKSNVILLDDSKMNKWVPRVSEKWDGGIPATLIVNSSNYNFYPNPFEKEELVNEIHKAIDQIYFISLTSMDLDQSSWEKQALTDMNGIILDVRTLEEFENSRIPNSRNIDFYNPQNFMLEIEKLDKDNNYYVYCRTGVRSANSCALMKELGFKNTFNLIGGIVDWKGKLIN